MSWSFVGCLNTDHFSGVTTQTINLPSGVNGGDVLLVMQCLCPTTAPQTVSLSGFTQVPTNGLFAGGADSSNFGDFFYAGTRVAGGSIGSATTDTTFTATYNSATYGQSLTFVLRWGNTWSIVGSGKYNGNAASTYSTSCPDASYSPNSASNAIVWCYAGQNSSKGTTASTFSGTGPSALSNFTQQGTSANGGGLGAGWIQSTSAPGGATANQAVDACDFAIEFSGTATGPVAARPLVINQAISRSGNY